MIYKKTAFRSNCAVFRFSLNQSACNQHALGSVNTQFNNRLTTVSFRYNTGNGMFSGNTQTHIKAHYNVKKQTRFDFIKMLMYYEQYCLK